MSSRAKKAKWSAWISKGAKLQGKVSRRWFHDWIEEGGGMVNPQPMTRHVVSDGGCHRHSGWSLEATEVVCLGWLVTD